MKRKIQYGCSLVIISLFLLALGGVIGVMLARGNIGVNVSLGEQEVEATAILPTMQNTPLLPIGVKPTFTPLVSSTEFISVTIVAQAAEAVAVTETTLVLQTPDATSMPSEPQEVQFQVQNEQVLFYNGPGTGYPAVGYAEPGALLPVIGRTPNGQWWQVCCLGGQPLWMPLNDKTKLARGDVGSVPVVDIPIRDASPTASVTPIPPTQEAPPTAPPPPPTTTLPPAPPTPRAPLAPPAPPTPLPPQAPPTREEVAELSLMTATASPSATATTVREVIVVVYTPTTPPTPTVTPPAPGNPECAIQGAFYNSIEIYGAPNSLPAASDPELNLTLRGYAPFDGFRQLVGLGGDTDPHAPQLNTLFADERIAQDFPVVLRVNQWDWNCNCRSAPIESPEVTMVGISSRPGELLQVPARTGGDIGFGYQAMVLYASPTQLTLKYTREDNVTSGYTLHIEGICVEPALQAYYHQLDLAGRKELPALLGKQPIGYSIGGDIKVVIRDSGRFMDPRSKKDWWQASGQ